MGRRQAWGVAGGVAGGAGLFTGGIAVGRLLRLDSQRGDYRRAWEDHDLATLALLDSLRDAPASDHPFTIVALGDSATQGIGASRVEEGYLPRLASAIGATLDRGVALLNLSISGGTSETVTLTELPQLRGLDLPGRNVTPDLFTLNIGGNDVMLADLGIDAFRGRMAAICGALPAGSLIGNIPSFGVLRSETRAAEMSQTLDEVATACGHHVVDLRALSEEFSIAKYAFGYHAADLFHPNSAAYADWAQRFADAWTTSRGLAPVLVSEAPGWEMLSARVAQSQA